MGTVCCSEVPPVKDDTLHDASQHQVALPLPIKEKVEIPEISAKLKSLLISQKPFAAELSSVANPVTRKFGNDVYHGSVGKGITPQGYGQMYRADGSYFAGEFHKGLANGPGYFVDKQGAIFRGELKNNMANCINGTIESGDFHYKGGFKNNLYHGHGLETSKSFIYQGTYNQGKREKGVLKWGKDLSEFVYTGTFNAAQQFNGKGELKTAKGVYTGQFVNGNKNGQGKFVSISQETYTGTYKNNQKNGLGKLEKDGVIIYQGEFLAGVPHGKGKGDLSHSTGTLLESKWSHGVNEKEILGVA